MAYPLWGEGIPMDNPWKAFVDYFALPAALITGWIFQWLPVFGFLVPIVYYSIQIWESKTFQQYRHTLRNRKTARIAAKILKLKAKIAAQEALEVQTAAVAKVVADTNVTAAKKVADLAKH
jgi:hypothetical protein